MRDEIKEHWRRLHKEELYDLYCSRNINRVIKLIRMRRKGHVACMGERRDTYTFVVGKLEGKGELRRPRHMWEENIKVDLQEV
jgi:hypothetical protein